MIPPSVYCMNERLGLSIEKGLHPGDWGNIIEEKTEGITMGKCSGNCEHCGGCAGELVLTQQEIDFLNDLGENAFMPVARSAADQKPVFLEKTDKTPEQYSLILICLEKKGLISIDYDQPLKGADMSGYGGYPIHGSIALTARGQEVLDVLDKQGAKE